MPSATFAQTCCDCLRERRLVLDCTQRYPAARTSLSLVREQNWDFVSPLCGSLRWSVQVELSEDDDGEELGSDVAGQVAVASF